MKKFQKITVSKVLLNWEPSNFLSVEFEEIEFLPVGRCFETCGVLVERAAGFQPSHRWRRLAIDWTRYDDRFPFQSRDIRWDSRSLDARKSSSSSFICLFIFTFLNLKKLHIHNPFHFLLILKKKLEFNHKSVFAFFLIAFTLSPPIGVIGKNRKIICFYFKLLLSAHSVHWRVHLARQFRPCSSLRMWSCLRLSP